MKLTYTFDLSNERVRFEGERFRLPSSYEFTFEPDEVDLYLDKDEIYAKYRDKIIEYAIIDFLAEEAEFIAEGLCD